MWDMEVQKDPTQHPQRFPGLFGPHVSDQAVNPSARLHMTEAWQTHCCHWSRSVAGSINDLEGDLEGDLCACTRECGCVHLYLLSISSYSIFRLFFISLCSISFIPSFTTLFTLAFLQSISSSRDILVLQQWNLYVNMYILYYAHTHRVTRDGCKGNDNTPKVCLHASVLQ